MAARGVHFAVTADQAADLLAAAGDEALMDVIEDIESAWDKDWLAESDKAWDAIHRCLTDGSLLYGGGAPPLNLVICGGRQLHEDEDYTVAFVTPEQVREVAAALEPVDEAWLHARYFSLLKPDAYDGDIGDDDFGYTWSWFQGVAALFRKAAADGRAVIFTVDA